MSRSEWAKRLPLIQAFVEGKTIQCRSKSNKFAHWENINDPRFDGAIVEYRIKPEPKVIWVNEYDDGSGHSYPTEEMAIQNCPTLLLVGARKAVKYVEVVE